MKQNQKFNFGNYAVNLQCSKEEEKAIGELVEFFACLMYDEKSIDNIMDEVFNLVRVSKRSGFMQGAEMMLKMQNDGLLEDKEQ